ncbi:acyltransferase family protein [Methylobacterium sp. J-068]|uniref:acyltransferase family protein n=1 Tax=Methylobacterium sp. J-068 TaxID=2836649 RepID=UPI001FBACE8C|nr:acyltransferase [Methylobacterium sp. J-068]MCJ2035714.1 acyltransferase [Methylobacterium sp. J-068]
MRRVPDAGPPLPPSRAHPPVAPLRALTALRFVAAAYVLVFHYAGFFFPGAAPPAVIGLGYSGVTFFFLLSGFILAYNYHAVDLSDRAALARFGRARVARIYPVYLVCLALSLPWFAAWVMKSAPPLQGLMAASGILAPLGLHAWVPGAACALDCPSWSVSAELFFYALFPLLLPLALRAPGRVALLTLGAWGAMSAAAILAWARYAPGLSLISPEAGAGPVLLAQAIKYNPLLRLPEFVAGLLLYAAWTRMRMATPALLGLSTLSALALIAAAPRLPEALLHNGLTALAWAPLILAGAQIRSGPLVSPWFVFLGRISFALYLVHSPVYALVNSLDRAALGGRLAALPWLGAGLAAALALALSLALHLGVEEPARRRILRRTSGEAAPLPAG